MHSLMCAHPCFGDKMDCIFCAIAEKRLKANVALDTNKVMAFHDINPQAPRHILIIPKVHVANISDLSAEHADVISEMMFAAKELAASVVGSDYRLVINNGAEAGQTVFHLHMHLLGGRDFSWPPG